MTTVNIQLTLDAGGSATMRDIMLRNSLLAVSFIILSTCLAFAQDDIAQQLLRESFACPSGEYEYKEPVNYYLKMLDRYHWVGNVSTFKLHTISKEMAGSIRGIDTREVETFVEVPFSSIDVSVDDRVDVTIHCKTGQQCIGTRQKRPGQDEAQYTTDHVYFHACSPSAADNIKVAIQQLIKDNAR